MSELRSKNLAYIHKCDQHFPLFMDFVGRGGDVTDGFGGKNINYVLHLSITVLYITQVHSM